MLLHCGFHALYFVYVILRETSLQLFVSGLMITQKFVKCALIFSSGEKKKAWLQKGFGLLCFLTHKHTHRCRRCRDVICTDMFEWSSDRVSEAGNVFNVTPTHLHQKQTSRRQHLFRQAHTERKKRLPYSAKVLIFWYQIFIKNRMEAI